MESTESHQNGNISFSLGIEHMDDMLTIDDFNAQSNSIEQAIAASGRHDCSAYTEWLLKAAEEARSNSNIKAVEVLLILARLTALRLCPDSKGEPLITGIIKEAPFFVSIDRFPEVQAELRKSVV